MCSYQSSSLVWLIGFLFLVTYIHNILERLRECNIDLGSYEDIQKRYQDNNGRRFCRFL